MYNHLKSFLFCTTILTTITSHSVQAADLQNREDTTTPSVGLKTSLSDAAKENRKLFSLSNSDLNLSIILQQQVQQELRKLAVETIEANQKNLQTMMTALQIVELDGQKSKVINVQTIIDDLVCQLFLENYQEQAVKDYMQNADYNYVKSHTSTGVSYTIHWTDLDKEIFISVFKGIKIGNFPMNKDLFKSIMKDKFIEVNGKSGIVNGVFGCTNNYEKGSVFQQILPFIEKFQKELLAKKDDLIIRLLGMNGANISPAVPQKYDFSGLSNTELQRTVTFQQKIQEELRKVEIKTIEANQKNLQTMIAALKLVALDGQKSKEVDIEAALNTYIHTQFIEHYKGQIINAHLHKIIGQKLQAMLPTGQNYTYTWKDSDVNNFTRLFKNVELKNWPKDSFSLRKLFTDKNISPNAGDVTHGVLYNERQGTCNMYDQLAPILDPIKSFLEAEEVKLKARLLG